MTRNKPYTNKLMILDIFLVLFTGPIWMIVVAFRELKARQ